MSLYYTTPSDPANYSVGRSSVIRAQFAALSAGFDLLPDPDEINQSRVTWCLDTGTANTILLDPPTRPAGYVIGLTIKFKALAANTGPTTVNVMGASAVLLGAKSLLRADGTVLATGDIVANQVCEITYDGTSFRLSMAFAEMSPAGSRPRWRRRGGHGQRGADRHRGGDGRQVCLNRLCRGAADCRRFSVPLVLQLRSNHKFRSDRPHRRGHGD